MQERGEGCIHVTECFENIAIISVVAVNGVRVGANTKGYEWASMVASKMRTQ